MIAAWIVLGVILALPFLIPEFETDEKSVGDNELGVS